MSNQTQPIEPSDIMKLFPNCVIPCFDSQQMGNCNATGSDGVACICRDIYWLTGNLVCIGHTCNSSDLVKFQNLFPQWCNAAFTLEARNASSSSDAQASATAQLLASVKPESLAGILVGSIAGGFLVMLLIVYFLWRRLPGSAIKRPRGGWEVDETKIRDDDASELEQQPNSPTSYSVRLPDRLQTRPTPPGSCHQTGPLLSEGVTAPTIPGDDNQEQGAARPSGIPAIPKPPVPSQAPLSYRDRRDTIINTVGTEDDMPPVPPGLAPVSGHSFLVL